MHHNTTFVSHAGAHAPPRAQLSDGRKMEFLPAVRPHPPLDRTRGPLKQRDVLLRSTITTSVRDSRRLVGQPGQHGVPRSRERPYVRTRPTRRGEGHKHAQCPEPTVITHLYTHIPTHTSTHTPGLEGRTGRGANKRAHTKKRNTHPPSHSANSIPPQ